MRHSFERGSNLAAHARPVVAVTSIEIVHGDSGAAWLGGGLVQLISADLARSPSVEIVSPERVRDAAARVGYASTPDIPSAGALAIGRRVGASWVVTGGLTHGETMYVLDVSVHDAGSGQVVRFYTVTAGNLLALSEAAAARILETTGSGCDTLSRPPR